MNHRIRNKGAELARTHVSSMKDGLRRRTAALLASIAALVATAASSGAATIYVGNNGIDGVSCGTKSSPCRSIAEGVAHAADGDKVSVGPGFYGDINGDGSLGGAGEEPLADCSPDPCMIKIDKDIDVVSQAGAFSTFIRPPVGVVDRVVTFAPPTGGTFGGKGKGFTIDAAGSDSAIVGGGATETAIVGNVILASGQQGILFVGLGATISGNRVICPAGSDTFGLFVFGSPATNLTDNAILGCSVGVATFGDIAVSSSVAVGNRIGIGLDGASSVSRTLAAGNRQSGIWVDATASTTSISESSVLGNGEDGGNCGIDANGAAPTVTDIWYGAATGPGVNPADQLCDSGSVPSPTFVDKPVKVKLKPIR